MNYNYSNIHQIQPTYTFSSATCPHAQAISSVTGTSMIPAPVVPASGRGQHRMNLVTPLTYPNGAWTSTRLVQPTPLRLPPTNNANYHPTPSPVPSLSGSASSSCPSTDPVTPPPGGGVGESFNDWYQRLYGLSAVKPNCSTTTDDRTYHQTPASLYCDSVRSSYRPTLLLGGPRDFGLGEGWDDIVCSHRGENNPGGLHTFLKPTIPRTLAVSGVEYAQTNNLGLQAQTLIPPMQPPKKRVRRSKLSPTRPEIEGSMSTFATAHSTSTPIAVPSNPRGWAWAASNPHKRTQAQLEEEDAAYDLPHNSCLPHANVADESHHSVSLSYPLSQTLGPNLETLDEHAGQNDRKYRCQWKGCKEDSLMSYDEVSRHFQAHGVLENGKVRECLWAGCNSDRFPLTPHGFRRHVKYTQSHVGLDVEKVSCATCGKFLGARSMTKHKQTCSGLGDRVESDRGKGKKSQDRHKE